MYYKLAKPIPYRTLSGHDIQYDCIYVNMLPKKGMQLIMSRTTGLPTRSEMVLTAHHIHCPNNLVVLRQNVKCIELSNELIRRGILTHEDTYPEVLTHFVAYKFYRFNHAHFTSAPLEKQIVS